MGNARGLRAALLTAIVLIGLIVLGLLVRPERREPLRSWLAAMSGTPSQPPLAAESPYRNIQPGVRFVGDASCVRCHEDIVESFGKHPMGRSLEPVLPDTIARLVPGLPASFSAQGLEYSVEWLGDRLVQRETRRSPDGRIVSRNEAVARYVLGSGEQAQAFLLERGNGYLFESPITWYSSKDRWDLSPGYAQDNLHFERFVKPACLFCHSNRYDHVAGTENRYRAPIFSGHAIGCERCHGPGELHVRRPEISAAESPNIVNPARLEPELREAVCQQCHLQGDIRIVRPGRSLSDFRPGVPLSAIETVFIKANPAGKTRFFGQVEQMYQSRCFLESRGKMGCTSCHDPHALPDPREKERYYRDRCVACHAEKGCGLPRAERAARGGEDRCIACHMPRSPNEQVPHTATTLHLISRSPGEPGKAASPPSPRVDRGALLVTFPDGTAGSDAENPSGTRRDLGIALATMGRKIPGLSAVAAGRLALPMLESALSSSPQDPAAWDATGKVLWQLGRREEALGAFQTALAQAPDQEEFLVSAGIHTARAGKLKEAMSPLERAIAINPWRADYHQALAFIHFQQKSWSAAIEALRKSIALNPWNHEARLLLVQCLLGAEQDSEARRELQALLDQDPPGRSALEQRFQRLLAP